MKILCISPHVDDVELMCGGSIAKWKEAGHEVIYLALIDAQKANLGFNMKEECNEACKILGVDKCVIGSFENRVLHDKRQDLLEWLNLYNKKERPDLVVCPSVIDKHQDHKTTAEECLRAFKCNIITYREAWNCRKFGANYFVPLKSSHLNVKLSALIEYKSQQQKHYFREEYIRSLAIFYGVLCGETYAEAFTMERWIEK